MTSFEDLSNELLYDIFDFLDTFEVFEIFSPLNDRFHHLLTCSSVPLHFDFSSMRQSRFLHHCRQYVTPNVHRAASLTFPHHLLVDQFWTQFPLDSFDQLRSVVLHEMRHDNSVRLLDTFVQLPALSSISIAIYQRCNDASLLYQSLFRLPKLKYCKVSLINLPVINAEQLGQLQSSIEQLLMHHSSSPRDVIRIVTSTPRLRRFSWQPLTTSISLHDTTLETVTRPCYLTHLSLEAIRLPFAHFTWFITRVSSRLRKLSIGVQQNTNFLDADRWQQLIVDHMPHLDVFELEHWFSFPNNLPENHAIYHKMTAGFTSSFWNERHCYFAHEDCVRRNCSVFFFHSIPSSR